MILERPAMFIHGLTHCHLLMHTCCALRQFRGSSVVLLELSLVLKRARMNSQVLLLVSDLSLSYSDCSLSRQNSRWDGIIQQDQLHVPILPESDELLALSFVSLEE